ncbi:hypothetical protein GGD83_004809 [Rhodoblastus sphagnicola]|nr:hypothetical protein [Rhodoblastus sphagnicola]MBB4200979.1 hypothetical protein [Rhodoblastus sphagnicola]
MTSEEKFHGVVVGSGALRKARDEVMIGAMSQAAYSAFRANPPTLERPVERRGAVRAALVAA